MDDNQDAAHTLAMLLEILGNETNTAFDGLEAIRVGAAFRPEVIFLDIEMPKLNGYQTCRKIRQESWGRNAVLVALTGWGYEEDRRCSIEAGFDSHLTKPAEPAEIEKLLASLASAAAPR